MTHPTPEALASFVDGTADAKTRAEVAEHIERCDDCLMVVGETARLLEEEGAGKIRSRFTPWMLLAAATAGVVFGAAWLFRHRPLEGDPLTRLARASTSLRVRPVEARLYAFAYAPLGSRGEAAADSELLRLHGVAGEVLREHDHGHNDAGGQHAAGVAALVTGHTSDAVRFLQRSVELAPGDATAWSDLSAAFYEAARSNTDPQRLVDALAAADHALHINPQLPDARFNRALALEALHLRDSAAAAYDAYLLVDSGSEWAAEARTRVHALRAKGKDAAWKDEKPVLDRAALAGDVDTVRRIVDAHRHDTRAYGEVILLNEWGHLVNNSPGAATERLTVARAIGAALYEVTGERLLGDAVKAIATSPSAESLAEAHRTYYDARVLYASFRPADARPLFEHAAVKFHEGGSPMEAVARYYVSGCLYNANHGAEALSLVDHLIAVADREYIALRAQLFWNRATILARDGDVHEVLRCQRESLTLLDRIGETKLAEEMSGAVAATESVLGRRSEAWRSRWSLFEKTSASGNHTAEKIAVELAARTEALARRWDLAHSLLAVALEPRNVMNAWTTSNAFIWRALAANRLGWTDEALRDVSEARQIALTVPDAGERAAATDMVLFATAVVTSDHDAAHAADLLSRYIEQTSSRSDRALLAEALIERAKARQRLNQREAALSDARSALAWLAKRRGSADRQVYRDAYFATADAATRLTVDLLESRGDSANAFSVLEKSRLTEPLADEPQTTPGSVTAEYLVLDDRVLIFIRSGKTKRIARVAVSAKTLQSTISNWTERLIDGEESNQDRQVASWLLDPIEELAGARSLVIVPDSTFSRLPFAALPYRSTERLVAVMPVAFAPDIVTATRPARPATNTFAPLVIGDPAFERSAHPDLNRLPHAAAEAEDIAAIYGTAPLTAEAASKPAVLKALINATLLHVAAHTIVLPGDSTTSSILLGASDLGPGDLYLRELQALRLPKLRTAVLTGCQTAAAIDNGGDPSSVALAFLSAGAENVVASIWDVDDRVGQRVGLALHRQLRTGMPAAAALQQVQLAMYRSADPATSNPRAWAGFRVYGNGL